MSSMKRRQELSGIHVVVIDDDDDARTIMKMVLEAHGAFVMVAENFASFGAALVKKLVAEIAEPNSVAAPREARARP